jgi:hypothetical protein
MTSTDSLLERSRAKRLRLERNKARRKKAPEYPVSEFPEPLVPACFRTVSRVTVLTTADGCVQLLVQYSHDFSEFPIVSIRAYPPTKLCSLCGIDTGLLSTTPLGIVCDWLADNGHEDSQVHRLLMFARDNPVPFPED